MLVKRLTDFDWTFKMSYIYVMCYLSTVSIKWVHRTLLSIVTKLLFAESKAYMTSLLYTSNVTGKFTCYMSQTKI